MWLSSMWKVSRFVSAARAVCQSGPIVCAKRSKWMMMNTHMSGGKCRIPLCRSERSAEQKWIYLACIPNFWDEGQENSIPRSVSSSPGANDRASVTQILPLEGELLADSHCPEFCGRRGTKTRPEFR
jgi:hypothetical protein